MTSFIYKNYTAGEVTGMSDVSFGFNILNERGQPILSFSLGQETMPQTRAPRSPRLLRRRLRSQGPH
jgi:hypothetical protein